MTKALVTIEVDFDTFAIPIQQGLGENSNPTYLPMNRIVEAKRDYIWDQTHKLLADKNEFIQITRVLILKEAK
jgi:hypothetical protein